ncbi:MAG: MFS transporter [Acidobacteria bacterium]|nr:MFS transporter [Acidobacteriota bacterium]
MTPAIRAEWQLSEAEAGWLTLAVQLGFVAGTLISALLSLPDVLSARRLFAASAVAGALANAAFGLFAAELTLGLVLRFATGACLAGVYPPGMKIMATWFRRGRGLALGVLVGALTLGKAAPYLVNAVGSGEWRANLIFVSALAVAGGFVVLLFVSDGPHALPPARFDFTQARQVFRNRGVWLANFGYLGHMWELYAMWTWTPALLRASFAGRGYPPTLAETGSFLVIGAGAAGCVAAGLLADRVGRTLVTSWAMAASGACCLSVGFLFDAHPALLLALMIVWGATVVADSAQFSSCVTELGDPQYLGTALTIQTCLGFLLTLVSIHLVPLLVEWVGWRYAFAALAPGPAFGIYSMLKLRRLPEAERIAQGKR